MTRAERDKTIRILQWLHGNNFLFRSTEEDVKFATEYAIKALQQEPCEDCISREHLLEEVASLKESPWFKDDTNSAMAIRKEAIEIVEDLCIRKEPSVNQQEPCEDCISRQAVLDINESHHGQMPNHINHQIWQEIKDLPSVNPQKIGHWIIVDATHSKCDRCWAVFEITSPNGEVNYCPNCGARMEG